MEARKNGFLKGFFTAGLGVGLVGMACCIPLATASAAPSDSMRSVRQGLHAQEKLRLEHSFERLPLYFVENQGQADRAFKFHDKDQTVFFSRQGVQLRVDDAASPVAITALGMNEGVELTATDPQNTTVSYFKGRDPNNWRPGLPTYGSVLYKEAFPGVDIKFYGHQQRLEYDLVVQPGADPSQIQFQYSGIDRLELSEQGDLVVHLKSGAQLIQKKPLTYQMIDGKKVVVESRFKLNGQAMASPAADGFTYGFELAAFDANQPLVIDPVLVYSTYLGGLGVQSGDDIAVDGSGNVYLTGQTRWEDAYIAKMAASGNNLDFVVYVGGAGSDHGFGIALGSNGVYVTGRTSSNDFPTTQDAFDTSLAGSTDGFVVKVGLSGRVLLYSTYFGGGQADAGYSIALYKGEACVTGSTFSNNFPVLKARDAKLSGRQDAFVLKLNSSGKALVYSTYLGGGFTEEGFSIQTDDAGNVYVVGRTGSSDFPRKNAAFPNFSGGDDAFLTKLNASGTALVYSTYLGGSGSDYANDLALDNAGAAYVTGQTASDDFPTKQAFQTTLSGVWDGFVTKFSASGKTVYSTHIGGPGSDFGIGIAVNDKGQAYITGLTTSSRFPTKNPLFEKNAGQNDAFVAWLSAPGKPLLFSTYLGGENDDLGIDIAVDNKDNVYVTGRTSSTDFPTKGAFNPVLWDETNGFLTKIGPTTPDK